MSNINEKNLGPRWYVAHTYTGYENKVKSSIERIVENRGLGHLIYDVKIPVEITVEVDDKGEEKTVENKIFPSYVLVKMTMTDESWHAVRTIPGVTGFVGPGSNPTPLSQAEVDGLELEEKYGVKNLPSDFKKKEGYKRSTELSKKHNLYRQNYCGCVYSKRQSSDPT